MSEFLIYPAEGSVTGPKMADFLGVESGYNMPRERYDYLVRWGSARRVTYIPSEFTLNKRKALVKSTNKFKSLQTMKAAGVPVPEFSRDWTDLEFPLLGRSNSHMEGRDIKLYLQPSDIVSSDFYVEYIQKELEYRVHVFCGEIFKISQKKRRSNDVKYNPVCWNYDTGWRFVAPDTQPLSLQQAIPAVTSHGLDFGAVDIIISSGGEPYVLEVNSAPGCIASTLKAYGDRIASKINLTEYPGLDVVDFNEEEEENEM